MTNKDFVVLFSMNRYSEPGKKETKLQNTDIDRMKNALKSCIKIFLNQKSIKGFLICVMMSLLFQNSFVKTVIASETASFDPAPEITEPLQTDDENTDDIIYESLITENANDNLNLTNSLFEIENAEDLLKIQQNPIGNFILVSDIDMNGIAWNPCEFYGVLDGNGYSVLNLSITESGKTSKQTYDGNMKVYDTCFGGMFDVLGGTVKNLNLINIRINVTTDQPCFIGPVSGYMDSALIENCHVTGSLQLNAHDRMFGVGGIAGYGFGEIKECETNVTLVCIDTDSETKDEQFMGGICAAGYPDIHDCNVFIRGFDSDHGYVHDGGLVGMYMFYPKGNEYKGSITGNYVTGKITFFEDNKNRRAYCNGFIGEIMNWDFENAGNKDDFVRDEVFTYEDTLMPHSCDNPVIQEDVIAPGCEFGYTEYKCKTCGYEDRDHYTLKVHDYDWEIITEATYEKEGSRQGICKNCGAVAHEMIPKLIEDEAEETDSTESLTNNDTEKQNFEKEESTEDAFQTVSKNRDASGTLAIIKVLFVTGILLMIIFCIVWFVRGHRNKNGVKES